MQESKYKIGEWENYRSIAKSYGLTIPKLKKILVEEGLVVENKLSKLALEGQIGLTEVISSRFGEDERILWQVPKIKEILAKRNIFELIGLEKFLFAENFHQITSNIAYLGRELLRFLKLSVITEDGMRIYPDWIQKHKGKRLEKDLVEEAINGLQEAIYENNHYLMVYCQSKFIEKLENDFQTAFKLTKYYPANEHEKMRLAFYKRLFQFFGEWATNERINQYHRQPNKLSGIEK